MAPPTDYIRRYPAASTSSVEEAYRRKCQQLKRRMNEVEESNDAAYLRVTRLRREIEKLRLERSFLLEQLSKRTPTNVEDSEGSPSPPPTPKDKPLRTKRGHRKPDLIQNLTPAAGLNHQSSGGFLNLSPSSETFSQSHQQDTIPPRASSPAVSVSRNGHTAQTVMSKTSNPILQPKNAFEQYCNEVRPNLVAQNGPAIAAGTYNIDQVLATGFQALDQAEKDAVSQRFEAQKSAERENTGEKNDKAASTPAVNSEPIVAGSKADEDVEMGDEAADGEAGDPKQPADWANWMH